MKVVLQKRSRLADNIFSFQFEKPPHFRYTAGQFIELYLPHNDPDVRGQKHWFTLSSSPTQNFLAITTRSFAETGSSFKKTLFGLRLGTEVEMSEPLGDFVLPKQKKTPLIFVAGGIGVTPFHSIVQWLHDMNERRSIQMIYAVENKSDLIFLDLFHQYGLELHTVAASPLTASLIATAVGNLKEKLIFISGPEPMTEALVSQFKAQGFPHEHLVTDYFPGYPTL